LIKEKNREEEVTINVDVLGGKHMGKLPYYIELYDMTEFARLVCALERIPRTSFSFVFDGKEVISVQMDVLKERPVNYYVNNQKFGHYLSYGFKAGK
jgi:hypothetical protein